MDVSRVMSGAEDSEEEGYSEEEEEMDDSKGKGKEEELTQEDIDNFDYKLDKYPKLYPPYHYTPTLVHREGFYKEKPAPYISVIPPDPEINHLEEFRQIADRINYHEKQLKKAKERRNIAVAMHYGVKEQQRKMKEREIKAQKKEQKKKE